MRVTFVVPFVNLTGGIRMVLASAEALRVRGHDVRVVYPAWPYRFHFTRREQWGEFRKSVRSAVRVPWFPLRVQLYRVPLVRAPFLPAADVIVATSWPTAHDVARLPPRCGRKFHLVMHHEAGTGPESRVRAVYRLPLARVAISRRVKDELERDFDCEVRSVVPCSVDQDLFHPDGAHRRPGSVLMLWHPDPRKGAADGLAALRLARARNRELAVTLCATVRPPALPDWVTLRYHPPDDALRGLYSGSSAFLYPSRYEGFGLPPLEAMACGCPVVSTRVGAVDEFATHGLDAMLVAPGDISGLADTLMAVLGDGALRRRLSENGRRAASRYSPEAAAAQLETALQAV